MFKLICEKCGAEGLVFPAKNPHVFDNTIKSEGCVLLQYGTDEEQGYDTVIAVRCKQCGAVLEDVFD